MDSRLDFLVIGAQKCATTWLYECMAAHPELHLPAHKRESWYLGGDLYEERGVGWYMDLLSGAHEGQSAGAVSVEYMYDPRAVPAVAIHAPQARFVVSLRDPIDRAISAYYWNLRKGQVPETGLEEALYRGITAIDKNHADDRPFVEMIRRGEYGEQLQRYVDRFGPDRILYLLYEDIACDPVGSLRRVCQYLGVDESFRPAALKSKPKQNAYDRRLVRLQQVAPNSRIVSHVMDLLNQWVARNRGVMETPEISTQLVRKLKDHYESSLDKLRSFIAQAPRENRPATDLSLIWRTLR
jgi:hypothetical protein